MAVDVVTGSQSVTGENKEIFLLVGANANVTLSNNARSSMYLTHDNEYVTLAGNDAKEHIFLYGDGDGITVAGKLTGLTDISGLANTNDLLTLASIAPAQITNKSDGNGGTLITLNSGGKIDFLGDPNVGIVDTPHGTSTVLGNT